MEKTPSGYFPHSYQFQFAIVDFCHGRRTEPAAVKLTVGKGSQQKFSLGFFAVIRTEGKVFAHGTAEQHRPVSYTHLDVYTRQVLSIPDDNGFPMEYAPAASKSAINKTDGLTLGDLPLHIGDVWTLTPPSGKAGALTIEILEKKASKDVYKRQVP